eukprot:13386719-Heterocapsa_arctica.AAC.1
MPEGMAWMPAIPEPCKSTFKEKERAEAPCRKKVEVRALPSGPSPPKLQPLLLLILSLLQIAPSSVTLDVAGLVDNWVHQI